MSILVSRNMNREKPSKKIWKMLRCVLLLIIITSFISIVTPVEKVSAEQPGIITTIAGGCGADGVSARAIALGGPLGVTLGSDGTVYIANTSDNSIRKVSPDGLISTFAGDTCSRGFIGDGGLASMAQFLFPSSVAVSNDGTLYIADSGNNRVRKVNPDGTIETVVGTGEAGYNTGSGLGTIVQLNNPRGIALGTDNNLYFVDAGNNRVRKLSPHGIVTTIAGDGECCFGGDGGPAIRAHISVSQGGVAPALDGSFYIADSHNHRIRRVDPRGFITTVVGTGIRGFSGDGGQALEAQLNFPVAIALGSDNSLYIADSQNARIRKVSPDGIITTVAGGGSSDVDGILATTARLSFTESVVVGSDNSFYIAAGDLIRKVGPDGIINTFAGNGPCCFSGDGDLSTKAQLFHPMSAVPSLDSGFYVADTRNHRVRKADSNGVITTVAGTGIRGHSGDGGLATSAQLGEISDIKVGPGGNLYIADENRVRKVDSNGFISTVAGNGMSGFSGDGGSATDAAVSARSLAIDADGNIYIAGSNRIRKVTSDGIINTIAGGGCCGLGDGGQATDARLSSPSGVAVALDGSIYIGDTGNNRVRKVDPSGIINTVAGTGNCGNDGDGGLAINSPICSPTGISVDTDGSFYISETGAIRVRKVKSDGIISTVTGNGIWGFSGDGGPATNAMISPPEGIALGSDGSLYIADSENNRVRKIWGPIN